MAVVVVPTSLYARARHAWTRAQHRVADLVDIAAFSLCPLPSWSTQVHLTNKETSNNNNNNNNVRKRATTRSFTIDQWTSLGSGGFVWGGARRLANHVFVNGDGQPGQPAQGVVVVADKKNTILPPRHHRHEQGLTAVASRSWMGLHVIELGAGTGALGLALAAMGANVTLTDQATFVYPMSHAATNGNDALQERSLLDLLKRNVRNNRALSQAPGQEPVQVYEMLWGSARHHAALPRPTFDLIVAADILLFCEAHTDLVATLRTLSDSQTVILLEHTDRSHGNSGDTYPNDMMHFINLLALDDHVLWEPRVIHDCGRHLTLRITRQDRPVHQDGIVLPLPPNANNVPTDTSRNSPL